MRRSVLAALLLLPNIAACGLGRSNSGPLPQGASAVLAPDADLRGAQGEPALNPAAPFIGGPGDLLYVANAGNNSITVYHTEASGNVAPIATIRGSKTELNSPGQLSEDANGALYVANTYGGELPASILVFDHGANGNVAPSRVIAGPLTGLSTNFLEALTVDQTTGRIFAMAGSPVGDGASSLIRFPANASGDVAPLATSAVGLYSAWELASDASGKHVIEASAGECCNDDTFGVFTFDKQFPNGANLQWIYSIGYFGTAGIADDPTTKTYLVSGGDGVVSGIFRFDEDTVGGGTSPGGPPHFAPSVVSVITSDVCGRQLALGYERNIYVTHTTSFGCATDAVYVYKHDASGNAKPVRILAGPATGLDQPAGIYEGK